MDDGRLEADERWAHDDGVVLDEDLLDSLDGAVHVAQGDGHMFRLAAVGDELVSVSEHGFCDLEETLAIRRDARGIDVIGERRSVVLMNNAEAAEDLPE